MIYIKKLIVTGLMGTLLTIILSGCSNFEDSKEDQVLQEPETVEAKNLKEGEVYVKNKDTIYEIPGGFTNYDYGKMNEYTEGVIAFVNNEDTIPTLYKEDQLVYYTSTELPKEYNFFRFIDRGYSIGLLDLELGENEMTYKFTNDKDYNHIVENSSVASMISDMKLKKEVISFTLDLIDEEPAFDYIDKDYQIVTGLSYQKDYTFGFHAGSKNYTKKLKADVHMFTQSYCSTSTSYSYTNDQYIIIHMPEGMESGYYSLNGRGLFRYINKSEGDSLTDVNLNKGIPTTESIAVAQ